MQLHLREVTCLTLSLSSLSPSFLHPLCLCIMLQPLFWVSLSLLLHHHPLSTAWVFIRPEDTPNGRSVLQPGTTALVQTISQINEGDGWAGTILWTSRQGKPHLFVAKPVVSLNHSSVSDLVVCFVRLAVDCFCILCCMLVHFLQVYPNSSLRCFFSISSKTLKLFFWIYSFTSNRATSSFSV